MVACQGLFVVLGKQSLQALGDQVIHRTVIPNLRRFTRHAVPRQISALANFIAVHGAFAPHRGGTSNHYFFDIQHLKPKDL